jgi:hypothetical protein
MPELIKYHKNDHLEGQAPKIPIERRQWEGLRGFHNGGMSA